MISIEILISGISHFMVNILDFIQHIFIINWWLYRLLWRNLALIFCEKIFLLFYIVRRELLINWILNIKSWWILYIKIVKIILLSICLIWLKNTYTLGCIIMIFYTFGFFYNVPRFLFVFEGAWKIVNTREFHVWLLILLVTVKLLLDEIILSLW